jgi:SAM domain (Sterile alpha motif)
VGWLRGLGLEEFEAAFRENKVDAAVLPKLTAEDLKDLGIAAVGDRRKLLEAIAALRTDTGIKTPSADIVTAEVRCGDRGALWGLCGEVHGGWGPGVFRLPTGP